MKVHLSGDGGGRLFRGQRYATHRSPTLCPMVWRRRRKSTDGSERPNAAVEIFTSGNGVLVEGSQADVAVFIDGMLEATGELGGRAQRVAAEGVALVANIAAVAQTHRQYIEFSDRARQLLIDRGAIPAQEAGYFRSFVRNGREFAGNLDWRPVDLSPEQALSLQAFAGQMALRAAIKELSDAVERIEGKIDQLADLAQAERLGHVVADRNTLQPLVDRVRSTGALSRTDWDTVAGLGPAIARDLESLRAYIIKQLKDVKRSKLVRSRVGAAEDLTDQMVRESLALLVVAEQNYALWQELRLAHAVNHEPTAVSTVTADIRDQLALLARADQALLELLQGTVDLLAAPTGYEGLAPIQKRRLRKHVAQLDDMCTWFGDQRHLDDREIERPEMAVLLESVEKARDVAADVARDAGQSLVSRLRGLREQDEGDEPGEPPSLGPGADST